MVQQRVRSSLVATAIAVAVALVMGLILQMGISGTAMFVLIMAAIAFVGTFAISSIIAQRHSEAPPTT